MGKVNEFEKKLTTTLRAKLLQVKEQLASKDNELADKGKELVNKGNEPAWAEITEASKKIS